MMRIVHTALRRDIDRAKHALSELPYPDDSQRQALSKHVAWMMGWLHHHHETEDAHLYPLVRRQNPAAVGVLDDMDADHVAIQPAIAAVEDAAARYGGSTDAREELLSALDTLSAVLVPHLQREEHEAMPVVSATLTQRQWRELEDEHNIKPLSKKELAFSGNWFVDGLSDADVAIVAALVPPIPRWIVRHVLVRGYRRAMFKCWRLPELAPLGTRLRGRTEHYCDAPPAIVWRILADVTRTGEWSYECHTAAWIDGSTRAAVGARFRGTSRSGLVQWSRTCTIHRCDEPHEFGYLTHGRLLHDSTEWLWTLHPDGTGTRIVQHYRIRSLPVWADRIVWIFTPAHHDRRAALTSDVQSLAALAERDAALPPINAGVGDRT
jgi:hemerythrin-like domain-containing protein